MSDDRELGTLPFGVKPSPRPDPGKLFIDSFGTDQSKIKPHQALVDIGHKFCFISVESGEIQHIGTPKKLTLIERIRKLVVNQETSCICIARVIPGEPVIDFGAFVCPPTSRDSIIDATARLAFAYQFDECYADIQTAAWFRENSYWSIYCMEKQEIIDRELSRLMEEKRQSVLARKSSPSAMEIPADLQFSYNLSLVSIRRSSDPAVKRMDYKSAYDKGCIGLTEELRQDKEIYDKLQSANTNSIVCDAASGAIVASFKYR